MELQCNCNWLLSWAKIMSDINRLFSENSELRAKIVQLEFEIDFLKTHPSIAQGIKGETLVYNIIGGEITPYAAPHDVTLGNGAKIEVKFSKRNLPSKGAVTRRWNWSNLLGWCDKGKDYDFLLLIGDKDPRFLSQYPSDGSPYVFFLIPLGNVPEILSKGGEGGSRAQINTNLKGARSNRSTAIKKYMVPVTLLSTIVGFHGGGDHGEWGKSIDIWNGLGRLGWRPLSA